MDEEHPEYPRFASVMRGGDGGADVDDEDANFDDGLFMGDSRSDWESLSFPLAGSPIDMWHRLEAACKTVTRTVQTIKLPDPPGPVLQPLCRRTLIC